MLHNILQYGFAGAGVLFAAGGWLSKPRRAPLWVAGSAAILAGIAQHYNAFWVFISLALIMIGALIASVRVIDTGWRIRAGIVVSVLLLCIISFWPTVWQLSGAKVWCPAYIRDNVSFRLVYGLDLRGGLRLVYTVDVEEAIRDKRDRAYEEMRSMLAVAFGFSEGDKAPTREALAKLATKVQMSKPRNDSATILLKFDNPADSSKLDERFNKRFSQEMTQIRNPSTGEFKFKIKSEVETSIRERAVTQAKETISRRIDELGLREASVVVRDEDIIIEVPGENEAAFQTIRDIISRTARLEFKILDDDQDYIGTLRKQIKPDELPKGVSLDNMENAPVGPGKTNPIHYATITKQPDETMNQALDRLKKFLAQYPVPDDHEIGYEKTYQTDEDTLKQTETGWRTFLLWARADITGDQIQDAVAMPSQDQSQPGGWHVALTFTDAGGDRFEEITAANIKRRFAIILDGKVASAPVIQTRIGGGHAQITMGASDPQTQFEESKQLELVLRSGALPAPITPSNEQRIGPSLGRDAIHSGVEAAAIGSGIVLVFMVVMYSASGLIADFAVLFNLLLQMAILSSFGASMTLPGIAGLALTIGMSVDANVLINERMREEIRAGKSPRAVVDVGYEKAFSAILDGHVTTLLSGLILAQYGTGPIKGFAVTLIVGVIASLFSTVFATRVVFELLVRGLKVKSLRLG